MAKIMIVDTVAFERITMKDILVQAGHKVVAEVTGGSDVISVYEREKPDFIFMDIAFPDEDGCEVVKQLLKTHPEANLCVCTTMAQQATIIQVIQLGAKDFIVKPYEPDRILLSIQKCLG